MTIAVRCACGGQFAAQPHLAGKTVRCPTCQQALQIPAAPREPLAPLVNPFSDAAEPVEAELVPPVAQPAPAYPQTQDPFGGKATVGGPGAHAANGSYGAASYAQPHAYAQPQSPQYGHGYGHGKAQKSNNSIYYVIGAILFGVFGFMLVAGIGVYQFIQELEDFAYEGFSEPLPVQEEDYQAARKRFKTRLTTRGPAPQEWEPLATPPGGTELSYQSGGHALRAFVDPPPADGKPRPGVVFLHGGFAWGDGDWEMPQPYRDQGFVVMAPVLRGENGQPGAFSLYYDEVEDVLAATSAFAALPYVDEQQLFICGHSAGGTLAALTALTTDQFQAVASFSGTMNQGDLAYWDSPELLVFDEADEQETVMRSPEAFARSFKCPAQLYYGSQEDWLEEETKRTATTARNAGLKVEAMVVGGDHMSSVRPAMLRSITFFRQIGLTTGLQRPPSLAAMPRPAPHPSLPPDSAMRPDPAALPDVSIPTMPESPDPTAGLPRFPTPLRPNTPRPVTPRPDTARPTLPRPARPNGPPGFHQGVVTFEVLDYSGRFPQAMSARRALIRSPWADIGRIEIDEAAGRITIPARKHLPVSTAEAKQALEELGFSIGTTTFEPHNAGADSKAADATKAATPE